MKKTFSITPSVQLTPYFNCGLTLTPDCHKTFEPILSFFEIEILRGEKTVLENGTIHYRFNVPDEKQEIIKQLMLKIVSDSSQS